MDANIHNQPIKAPPTMVEARKFGGPVTLALFGGINSATANKPALATLPSVTAEEEDAVVPVPEDGVFAQSLQMFSTLLLSRAVVAKSCNIILNNNNR